jgi:hypothetical protein
LEEISRLQLGPKLLEEIQVYLFLSGTGSNLWAWDKGRESCEFKRVPILRTREVAQW